MGARRRVHAPATRARNADRGAIASDTRVQMTSYARFLAGVNHGFEDAHVAGAAADVSCQRIAHGAISWLRRLSQQIEGSHQHSGRAYSALRAATCDKRLLHVMQSVRASQAF